jgi:hypothetical protein
MPFAEAREKTYWILPGKLMAEAFLAHPKTGKHRKFIFSFSMPPYL